MTNQKKGINLDCVNTIVRDMCRSWNSVINHNLPNSRMVVDSFHAVRRIQKKLYDNGYVPLRKYYLRIAENKEAIAKKAKKEKDKCDAVRA